MKVYGVKLTQHGEELIMFKIDGRELVKLVEVKPSTRQHPTWPQRFTKIKRCRRIAEYLSGNKCIPPAIIINLYDTVRVDPFRKMGEDFEIVEITFPDDRRKHAWCVDGQHRLKAFDPTLTRTSLQLDENVKYELPVVAYRYAPMKMWAEQFVTINYTQEPVDKNLMITLDFKYGSHVMLEDENDHKTVKIIDKLNRRRGILHHKILFTPPGRITSSGEFKREPSHHLVTVKTLWENLRGHVRSNVFVDARGRQLSVPKIAKILDDYFAAWHLNNPIAWGNPGYVLTKTGGWAVMCSVFDKAYEALFEDKHGRSTVKNWKSILRVFKRTRVNLRPRGPYKVVDWKSEDYRQFCSGKVNIQEFVDVLKEVFERGRG